MNTWSTCSSIPPQTELPGLATIGARGGGTSNKKRKNTGNVPEGVLRKKRSMTFENLVIGYSQTHGAMQNSLRESIESLKTQRRIQINYHGEFGPERAAYSNLQRKVSLEQTFVDVEEFRKEYYHTKGRGCRRINSRRCYHIKICKPYRDY